MSAVEGRSAPVQRRDWLLPFLQSVFLVNERTDADSIGVVSTLSLSFVSCAIQNKECNKYTHDFIIVVSKNTLTWSVTRIPMILLELLVKTH